MSLHHINNSPAVRVVLPHTGASVPGAQHLAATRLQAMWRGYRARQTDPLVLRVRQEIRARRAEDHIRHLSHQLDRWVGLTGARDCLAGNVLC